MATDPAWLDELAAVLERAPPEAYLYYTTHDDGVWLDCGKLVHLGFSMADAIAGLKKCADDLRASQSPPN